MSRIIFCHFLQQDAEGLNFQIYPGEIGKQIYQQISKEAWSRWMEKQTMLINEKKLSMLNSDDRKLIEREMIDFLFHGKNIDIKGYTPPTK